MILRVWGGQCLAYHEASGDVHLLSLEAGVLLEHYLEGHRGEELVTRIFEDGRIATQRGVQDGAEHVEMLLQALQQARLLD